MILDVDHVEQVGGGPGFVLVRIAGDARAACAELVGAPALLIARDETADAPRERVAPSPTAKPLHASPGGEPFSYDYAVPLHLMEARGDWWLDPGAPEPAPDPAPPAPLAAAIAPPQPAVAAPQPDPAEEHVQRLRERLLSLSAQLTSAREEQTRAMEAALAEEIARLRERHLRLRLIALSSEIAALRGVLEEEEAALAEATQAPDGQEPGDDDDGHGHNGSGTGDAPSARYLVGLREQAPPLVTRRWWRPGRPAAAPTAAPAPAPPSAPTQTAQAAQAPVRIPRSKLAKLRPTLPVILVTAGTLAVTDAIVTATWQEPLSALYTHYQQGQLDDQLDEVNASVAVMAASPAVAAEPPEDRTLELARSLNDRTSPGKPIGQLTIPRINAKQVMVQGTGTRALRRGPGHYLGTALPGEDGTVGVAGHRTTYGAPFRHIDKLRRGDSITVRMPYGEFRYLVEGTRIVKPADVSVLKRAGHQRLVLTACHPLYSAAKRIVVLARLQRSTPIDVTAAATGAAGHRNAST